MKAISQSKSQPQTLMHAVIGNLKARVQERRRLQVYIDDRLLSLASGFDRHGLVTAVNESTNRVIKTKTMRDRFFDAAVGLLGTGAYVLTTPSSTAKIVGGCMMAVGAGCAAIALSQHRNLVARRAASDKIRIRASRRGYHP